MDERRIVTAEMLAVGAELLVGDTQDTNSGDLARELTKLGVEVLRLSALPDRLEAVAGALHDALDHADLVVTTGGLGPTPDDLTREAIAHECGETVVVDPDIERWLRDLFHRRGIRYSEANRKQAWLIPSATSLANPNGTAPGWWVDRPDGRVIVALPGPPREMRPMWRDHVLPRLVARGLGADRAVETLRLSGIGESLLVDVIGEEVLRRRNPEVATYARVDAVDVRVSASAEGGRTARELVDEQVADLLPALGGYIFARGDDGWPAAVRDRLAGRTVAIAESGTAGQLVALLGAEVWLAFDEATGPKAEADDASEGAATLGAARVRQTSGADVGLCVLARDTDGDMAVAIAMTDGDRSHAVTRTAFLGGDQGRRRAANLACTELWRWLGQVGPPAT
jgi:nicotinamide-nucleotide amidase